MQDKPLRLFVADAGDVLFLSIESILEREDPTALVIPAHNLTELNSIMHMRNQVGNRFTDLLIVGHCLSSHHSHRLALLDSLSQLCQMPQLLVGDISHGWFIHHLLHSAGISAFIHRHDALDHCLTQAIKEINIGRTYLSPMARRLVNEAEQSGLTRCIFGNTELDVIKLLAQGQDPGQIAYNLGIQRRQVYAITRRLRYLFGVPTNEALMTQVQSCGLLTNITRKLP